MAVVKFFGNLRQIAGVREIEMPGSSVEDIFQALCRGNESLCEALFDGTNLKPFLRVMLNGQDIELAQGLETSVSVDSTIAVFPPIAGG